MTTQLRKIIIKLGISITVLFVWLAIIRSAPTPDDGFNLLRLIFPPIGMVVLWKISSHIMTNWVKWLKK